MSPTPGPPLGRGAGVAPPGARWLLAPHDKQSAHSENIRAVILYFNGDLNIRELCEKIFILLLNFGKCTNFKL